MTAGSDRPGTAIPESADEAVIDPVFGVPHQPCSHRHDEGFVGGCEVCHADEYVAEILRLRAALEAIKDFQPEFEELGEEFGAEVTACQDCEVWRRKQHPIQRMCERHVRRSYAVRDSNAQSAAYQHYTMRDIARRALDSGRTVTPPKSSENGSTQP